MLCPQSSCQSESGIILQLSEGRILFMKRMQVEKLGIDLLTHDPVVILKDSAGRMRLPILIGPFEATAIALALEGSSLPRPLAHDLMASIVLELGAKVDRIIIDSIKNNTFYAKIVLEHDGRQTEIDARPSDCIALALRTEAPIFVDDRIVIEESVIERKASDPEAARHEDDDFGSDIRNDRQKLRNYIDSLKPSDFLNGFGGSDNK